MIRFFQKKNKENKTFINEADEILSGLCFWKDEKILGLGLRIWSWILYSHWNYNRF